MKIRFLGHASFLMTSSQGTRVITDPGGGLNESADIVTLSHWHHNGVYNISGEPKLYIGPAPVVIKDIKLSGVVAEHGANRGRNMLICIETDGVRICHLGDIGHTLTDEQLKDIGKIDIFIIPVMGLPVMTLETSNEVFNQLQCKVIFPMHYVDPAKIANFGELPPGAPDYTDTMFHVEDFLKDKPNVVRLDVSEVEFTPETLPSVTQILVPKSQYPNLGE